MKKLVLLLAVGIVSMADAFAGVGFRPLVSEVVAHPAMGRRLGPALVTTDPSSNVTVYTIRCDMDYPKEVCFVTYTSSGSVINVDQENGVLPENNGYVAVDFGDGIVASGTFNAHYNAPVDGDVMLREHRFFVAPLATPSTN